MARKDVLLKDRANNILEPETNIGQIKDSNGDTILNANPSTKKISGMNSYKIDGSSIADASITAEKLSSGVIPTAESLGAEVTSNKVTSIGSSATDTEYPSAKAVYDAIEALPEPMVFKGTLGDGGTISSLPAAAAANKGFTYKVITAGTYQSLVCKIGDTVISTGTEWVLIPSGDEPSGTVTNVAASGSNHIAVTGSPITSSGTLGIGVESGYQIPSDTQVGNISKALYFNGAFDSADGKTRQTGYIKITSVSAGYMGNQVLQCVYVLKDSVDFTDVVSVIDTNIVSNYTKYSGGTLYRGNYTGVCAFKEGNNRIIITVQNCTTLDQVNAYLSQNPIYIQYKLATPYTDTPIEGESILPLDTNMANKIRQKVVDGLNLWDEEWINGYYSSATGEYVSNANYVCSKNKCKIKPSTTYSLKPPILSSSGDISLLYYDNSGNYISYYTVRGVTSSTWTFTTPSNATQFNLYITDLYGNTYNHDIMLTESNHPYPHSDFNQKEHTTNAEATLLKNEYEKCSNLWKDSSTFGINTGGNTHKRISSLLEVGKTYTCSFNSTASINVQFRNSSDSAVSYPITRKSGYINFTFTMSSSYDSIFIYANASTTITNFMLTETSYPVPYHEYCGEILHEKSFGYTRNEVDTGFTWINGKKIYKKSFIFYNLSLTTDYQKILNNDEGMSVIVDYELALFTNSHGLPYNVLSGAIGIRSDGIYYKCSDTWEPSDIYLTLYYFK